MAGTSFLDIYTRAIAEFQDPALKSLYSQNLILFCQVMNNFMQNAISLFTNPLPVKNRLSGYSSSYELTDNLTGNGVDTTFPLTISIPEENVDSVIFMATVDGTSTNVSYIQESNSVEFETAPADSSSIVVSCYYPGEFAVELYEEEKYILSQWVLVCWSEYIENNRLDIDRLLGDTDFKLTSNSTTTQAKTSWYIVNRETVGKRMAKYAWDAAILGIYK